MKLSKNLMLATSACEINCQFSRHTQFAKGLLAILNCMHMAVLCSDFRRACMTTVSR